MVTTALESATTFVTANCTFGFAAICALTWLVAGPSMACAGTLVGRFNTTLLLLTVTAGKFVPAVRLMATLVTTWLAA